MVTKSSPELIEYDENPQSNREKSYQNTNFNDFVYKYQPQVENSEEIKKFLSESLKNFKDTGNYNVFYNKLKDEIKKNNYVILRYYLSILLFNVGRMKEALQEIEIAIEMRHSVQKKYKEDVRLFRVKYAILNELRRFNDVIYDLENREEKFCCSTKEEEGKNIKLCHHIEPCYQEILCEAYYGLGKYEECLKLCGDNFNYISGKCLLKMNKPEEGKKELSKGIEKMLPSKGTDPVPVPERYATLYYYLKYSKQNDSSEASIMLFEHLIKMNKYCVKGYILYSKFFFKLKKYKEALEVLNRVCFLRSSFEVQVNIPFFLLKAEILFKMGEKDKAEKILFLVKINFFKFLEKEEMEEYSAKKLGRCYRKYLQLYSFLKGYSSESFDFRAINDPKNMVGDGGYATVFKSTAVLKSTMEATVFKSTMGENCIVAIKKISLFAKDRENQENQTKESKINNELIFLKIVFKEVSAMEDAKCEYNVPIITLFLKDNYIYLIMPFYAGGSLQSLLEKNMLPESSWEIRLEIAKQLAKGLKKLHDAGYIHHDLKSYNALIEKPYNKGDKTIKVAICDFGLASKVSIKNPSYTLAWAAPELINKKSTYTKAVDIYSFGVLMWEIFSGNLPFKGEDPSSLQTKIIKGEKKISTTVIKIGTPQFIKDLIKNCINEDEEKRPTIEKIIEILEKGEQKK